MTRETGHLSLKLLEQRGGETHHGETGGGYTDCSKVAFASPLARACCCWLGMAFSVQRDTRTGSLSTRPHYRPSQTLLDVWCLVVLLLQSRFLACRRQRLIGPATTFQTTAAAPCPPLRGSAGSSTMAVMRTAAVSAWSGAAVVAVLLTHAADAFVVNTAGV